MVLYKSITADTQVYAGPCRLIGAELSHTGDTNMVIYGEEGSSKTVTKKVSTLKTTDEKQTDRYFFPEGREPKLPGIFIDWTAGLGTIFYEPV